MRQKILEANVKISTMISSDFRSFKRHLAVFSTNFTATYSCSDTVSMASQLKLKVALVGELPSEIFWSRDSIWANFCWRSASSPRPLKSTRNSAIIESMIYMHTQLPRTSIQAHTRVQFHPYPGFTQKWQTSTLAVWNDKIWYKMKSTKLKSWWVATYQHSLLYRTEPNRNLTKINSENWQTWLESLRNRNETVPESCWHNKSIYLRQFRKVLHPSWGL